MIKRIETPKDLKEIAGKEPVREKEILLCAGGGCIASGAMEIKKALEKQLEAESLDIPVKETGCMGPCVAGPIIKIIPGNIIYESLSVEDIPHIVKVHFKQGKVAEKYVHRNIKDQQPAACEEDIDFFKNQEKVVLRNCGRIDPQRIEDYIAARGYEALSTALMDMKPEDVVQVIKESGLRGRGGAGFPTWLKWNFTRMAQGDQKYVLCNADEGDPGAFMDRSVLEGDPHSLIEGMSVAAYTVGASRGYVYVRAEYPLAVARLNLALEQARDAGLLGENILGSGFDFDLHIKMGSGAFVCGEETALIHSIEGKRGEPRPRPPFPAQSGLWGKPSLLNNVETYANVAAILLNGAPWYADLGTAESGGTKVFALAGAISNTGLAEVPIGLSLGELIYDIGGGIKNGKNFKAAQIGGPSGGCVPRQYLNVSLDYSSLAELGAIMGSGGLIVMDDDTCMVDVARFFLEFVQEESCGKCVPCRVGTKRMLEILTRICEGRGQEGDIEQLIELGEMIKETALCGLGQTAPNPVLSTIRHFRHEYEDHIKNKHCDAGICPGLVRAPCQSACPASVDIPGFISLTNEKRYEEALKLHRERNPFAAVCSRVCFHTCEDRCRRSSLDAPVSVRGVKRFLVEQEKEIQVPEIRENALNASKKIAIVGAGPAGLSCAYFLARLGYKPVIFEAEQRPGGMLVQTIPAYRLPRETLAKEIRMIENMGVTIKTGRKLGKDFTLAGLKSEGYQAVFLGIGASKNLDMGIPGEDADGVVQAVPFLKEYNLRGSVPVGKKVVVIGGGNAAIDAARTSIRLGAEEVTVVYRRSQEQMPAYEEEIEEALFEGVKLRCLTQPVSIEKDKSGKVTGLQCLPMELGEFDRSGRRRALKTDEQSFLIETDQVIMAIGQRLDKGALKGGDSPELSERNFIKVNPVSNQTDVNWLFAGGDAVSGPSSVVDAIAEGEKAAVSMDIFLTGENNAFWREEKAVDTAYNPDEDPVPYQREKLPLLAVDKRTHNFDEVEQCWTETQAVRQGLRCLRCDYGKKTVAYRPVTKEDINA